MVISRFLPASGCFTALAILLCPIGDAAEPSQENPSDQRTQDYLEGRFG